VPVLEKAPDFWMNSARADMPLEVLGTHNFWRLSHVTSEVIVRYINK